MKSSNPRPERRASATTIFMVAATAIVAAVTALARHFSLHALPGFLIGVNVATVLLYGYDKAVAGGTRLRVPERVLHLLALAGGSPAALLGQSLLRHKTAKTSFQRMYWLIVVLQLAIVAVSVWCWLHPPSWTSDLLRSSR